MQYRRRLTFQLTPLLDLLLIVIFAQYMEVQQAAATGESVLLGRNMTLEKEFQQRHQDLESAHKVAMKALETDRVRFGEQFQSILDQHQQAKTTLAETFNLPLRVVEEALRLKTSGQTGDAERLEKAVRNLQQLLESRNSELLRFLIRYDEMRKHVSIWELHLLENGQALFTDGKLTQRLSFESSEEFGVQCFILSNSFEEPRPLTLILMTYADTQAGFRRSAVEGLPIAVQRLRDGAGGTRWYDYSFMGFRPDGPLISPDGNKSSLSQPENQP